MLRIEFSHDCKAVKEAIEIVMKNNRMRFGNLIYHQIRGVAMGMSPTPNIANLYVTIYKHNHIIPLVGVNYLLFYKRFINDGFAVWLHDKDPTTDAVGGPVGLSPPPFFTWRNPVRVAQHNQD